MKTIDLIVVPVLIVLLVFFFFGMYLNATVSPDEAAAEVLFKERITTGGIDEMRSLQYFRDVNTGLCFARTGLGRNATMANVDCTGLEDVLTLINND
jgi:hypothetical protein